MLRRRFKSHTAPRGFPSSLGYKKQKIHKFLTKSLNIKSKCFYCVFLPAKQRREIRLIFYSLIYYLNFVPQRKGFSGVFKWIDECPFPWLCFWISLLSKNSAFPEIRQLIVAREYFINYKRVSDVILRNVFYKRGIISNQEKLAFTDTKNHN